MMKLNDRSPGVAILQRWLNGAMGTTLATDGHFGRLTHNALRAFQASQFLTTDGIFGPTSFRALQRKWCPRPSETGQTRVTADAWDKGYNSHTLRSRDAAHYYREMYAEAKQHGILVTSSGSLRALNADVSVGRSATSLHYLSIAFDLFIGSGMGNPDTDPYVLQLVNNRWIVWARVYDDKAPLAPKDRMTIERPITMQARRGRGKPTEGVFVNFTELAAKYGFLGIPPWRTFLSGGSWITAEWWHFQNEWCLMPGFSSLGGELALVYSPMQLQGAPPMRSAGVVWKRNWFG
jgi:hypothetical protein